MIDLLTGKMSWDENRIARVLKGIKPLHEENGKLRNSRFGFLGVPAIVQTNPENLGRHEWREELSYVGSTIGGLQLQKQRAGEFDGGAVFQFRA